MIILHLLRMLAYALFILPILYASETSFTLYRNSHSFFVCIHLKLVGQIF